MKRRKIGRKTAKARVKPSRRNAPKGAGVRAAIAKDIDVAQIRRERHEALHQQAATAEILKLISSSPADTQPVLDAIVRSGLKLFPDAAIFIALPDGDKLRAAALAGSDPATSGSVFALVVFRMPRICATAIAPELGGGMPQSR